MCHDVAWAWHVVTCGGFGRDDEAFLCESSWRAVFRLKGIGVFRVRWRGEQDGAGRQGDDTDLGVSRLSIDVCGRQRLLCEERARHAKYVVDRNASLAFVSPPEF